MKYKYRIIAAAAVVTMLSSAASSAYAALGWTDASAQLTAEWEAFRADWDSVGSDFEQVALTPGRNETELGLAWYSHTAETPAVRISKNADMSDAEEFSGTQETVSTSALQGCYSNKVTVTGLENNTEYFYRVMKNGEWTAPARYTVNDPKSYSILYVSDPQIGASKNMTNSLGEYLEPFYAACNDSFNWNRTLNNAVSAHPDISFILSAGDQVNVSDAENEYAGYLAPALMRSLPSATAIGTHDQSSKAYTYHFNNPNADIFGKAPYLDGKTTAGTDYFFSYGDVLYVILDANNYNCDTHRAALEMGVKAAPDAKWRVVMLHNDIYGSGDYHSYSDGMILRTQLTPLFDEFDVDMVLQGHDHVYSRSYQISGDGKEHKAFNNNNWHARDYYAENQCYVLKSSADDGNYLVDPEGTVYFEVNSCTGSKFYALRYEMQDFIAERGQSLTPSYSVISFTETKASVEFYDALTNEPLADSTPYTIVKRADSSALADAVETAMAKVADDKKYTENSAKRLDDALKNAQKILDDPEALSADIATAAENVKNAANGLEEAVVTTSARSSAITTKTTTRGASNSPKTADDGVGAVMAVLALAGAVVAMMRKPIKK